MNVLTLRLPLPLPPIARTFAKLEFYPSREKQLWRRITRMKESNGGMERTDTDSVRDEEGGRAEAEVINHIHAVASDGDSADTEELE